MVNVYTIGPDRQADLADSQEAAIPHHGETLGIVGEGHQVMLNMTVGWLGPSFLQSLGGSSLTITTSLRKRFPSVTEFAIETATMSHHVLSHFIS